MINDEISIRAAYIEVLFAKGILKEILKQIQRLRAKAKQHDGLDNLIKHEGKEMKLKDMVKKGQLEEINVKDGELKELKKELNRCGVNFSIMRDKESSVHSVFFLAKDTKVMDQTF